ncbi:MAG: cyclic nucleotide-binding domain-containing protein [Acidobacteria bacterium]|nr:cyclic nucleotide-binding domain-containing protein [Acidobacteriota bacterium]
MNYFELAAHAASILTAIAYLVKDILWLRLLTILACIAGIVFNYFLPQGPLWVVIHWNLLFLTINLVQVAIIIKERREVSFSEEEKELYETLFKNFAPFEFMKLLRIGQWLEAQQDEVLAIEQKELANLMLIYNGLVRVEAEGETLAQLKDGSFIGEMSFITGGTATATVKAVAPTRYLSWSKADLRQLFQRNPSMRFAMQTVISTDLTKKLMRRPHTALQT